jgi:hypothetical protein
MSFPKARASAGAATTALWLGAALLLAAGSGFGNALGFDVEFERVECLQPREIASADGWTTEVSCLPGANPTRALRGPARLLFGLTLDLNRADAKALEVLPRIGPRRAAAIVRAREQAEFASVEELVRVRGIGPKTLEGLAGWVGVGESR